MEKMPDSNLQKAKSFFERAEEVATTKNFDYAIEMFISGLRLAPDAVEEGHIPLRKLALLRNARGGKKPSMINKFKRQGKESLEEMLAAEGLLARDPDHLHYAEAMLKAAAEGGYAKTVEWIAGIIFEANRCKTKPSFASYILLKDSYAAAGLFEKAINACDHAAKLKPKESPALQDQIRDLSARLTVQKGRYGEEGDFRQSILNRESQEKLHSQDQLIKTVDYRKQATEDARKDLESKPDATALIIKLVDALYDQDTAETYEEAISILRAAHERLKDFTFKRHENELAIKKLKKRIRALKKATDSNPDDSGAKQELENVLAEFGELELDHYRQCVEFYPTDARMKYEYGVRLTVKKDFDKAIPLFQDAQKDPRLSVIAMDKTGLCFFFKGWLDDAIDIFNQALEACPVKDNAIAKELRYNLARSYEGKGQLEKALELYRRLAQLDFNYKDVRKRVDDLRSRSENE
jgi:tetratricopeptide (TPR) repeat protein